jgi:hypothetical protein
MASERGKGEVQEERRLARSALLAVGTLACPACDLPVVPDGAVSPAAPLGCPFCGHAGAVRDFLSLTPPTRPTRVAVRVVHRSCRTATG